MGRTEQVEEESVVASILAPTERPKRVAANADVVDALRNLILDWLQERQMLEGRDTLGTSAIYDWILRDAQETMHYIDKITESVSFEARADEMDEADDAITQNLEWLVTLTRKHCETLHNDSSQRKDVVQTQYTLSARLFYELSEFVE